MTKRKRTYYISVIDDDGYKYKQHFNAITNGKAYPTHSRFFHNNPYTEYNIYNFMKNNNIFDLKILSNIAKCNAKTIMDVEIKGNIYKISWNDISSKPYKFNIYNIDDFIYHIKVKKMTKSEVSNIVLRMYNKKGSPLTQEDFDGKTTESHVGIRLIEKHFGSLINMQKELNLPIPSQYRILNDEDILSEIKTICNKVYINENRKIIITDDFKKYGSYSTVSLYRNRLKKMGYKLNDVIKSFGFEYQKTGNGLNYEFYDGEIVVSKYEYNFSNFLRNNGFIYNKTYFRNVDYRKLDNEYDGKMNCDYCINFDNKLVYIELAGLLGNKEH